MVLVHISQIVDVFVLFGAHSSENVVRNAKDSGEREKVESTGTLCLLALYYTNVARCNMKFTLENSLPRADCHISHTGNSTERQQKLLSHSPEREE